MFKFIFKYFLFRKAGSDYRREKMLTVVGFALFVALCFSTVFYVLLYVNAIQVNVGRH